MEMSYSYRPYFDPEYDSLLERIHPPRVCIDNDSCRDCTLVKVDSANKHGILLEMVQVLTDLDLVISKSYISSDGGWFMDVFHVTDQLGNKITDEGLIHYIKQTICASRKAKIEMQTSIGLDVRPRHVSTDRTALEMTGADRPGMMSEISATLAELGCNVSAAVAWTYNSRVACILYVEDGSSSMPITDPCRLARIQTQLENVVEAHHCDGERRSVKLAVPTPSRTHTERRLHQLMADDRDYDESPSCATNGEDYQPQRSYGRCRTGNEGTEVTIEKCEEKGYSIVTVRSKDRPKLLFDTVCVLTDMQYVVFHAAMSSQGSMAIQEYYIRQKDGHTLNTGNERLILTKCLTAAVERRVSHGLRLDVSTQNRLGLLSDVTRVLRENGLTIVRAELGTRGERAIGSFYVTDTGGYYVTSDTVEAVRKEIGGSILAVDGSATTTPETTTRTSTNTSRSTINDRSTSDDVEERPRFSIGCLLWSHLERLSHNFKPIKS